LMLSKLGFVIGEASDGIDAMAKIGEFGPDVVLLDNVMPRMSGWELTKTLKADERYRDIPIIMFSALDDVKDKVAGFNLGVDDYITKPFNFSEVLARIKAILRTRELFAQIAKREARLILAERLSLDIRQNLRDLEAGVDGLDAALASGKTGEVAGRMAGIRGMLGDLDGRMGSMASEWENLKKHEIGLSTLEDEARKIPGQGQE